MKDKDTSLHMALLEAQNMINRPFQRVRVDGYLLEFYQYMLADGHGITQEPIDTQLLFFFIFEAFEKHIRELERAWRQVEQICQRMQENE